MVQNGGTDATNEFEQVFHSQQARQQLSEFLIGILDSYKGPLDAALNSSSQPSGSSTVQNQSQGSSPIIYVIPIIVIAAAVIYQFVL